MTAAELPPPPLPPPPPALDPAFVADATVVASDVSVWFGQKVALSDLSCSFGAGVTGLLGPNGAGKTTLMRAITGLIPVNQGNVVVDGRSDGDAGMSLTELADFMSERLGVTAALNLDGGGSATLAARDPEGAFHVINNPMDAHNVPTPGGSRELYSAIVFTQL